MDCEAFFGTVEERLSPHSEDPTRTVVGDQCVLEFYHPSIVERLGTGSLVSRFNRSGVVWAPRADHLKVKLRVPDAHRRAVVSALAAAPFAFDETDHRVVGDPDGDLVPVLHYSISTDGVTETEFEATIDAVGAALSV